jgi:Protein of unknown function (DUF4242)
MPTGTRTLPATTSRSIELPIKTKTFCVYEGPSEAAVRKAAEQLNKLPIDSIPRCP